MSGARDLWRDIGDGLRAEPGRTASAFLALTLGGAALALMTAFVAGLQDRASRLVREFGASLVVLTPAAATASDTESPLPAQLAEILTQNLPEAVIAGVRRYEANTAAGEAVPVLACDPALARARGWTLPAGRFLDERDLAEQARAAVLSSSLADAWGAAPGQSVILNDIIFEVVGVVECRAPALASATNHQMLAPGERVVFVPRTTPLVGGMAPSSSDAGLDALFVRLPDDARFAPARARLARLVGDPALRGAELAWIEADTLLSGVRRLRRMIDWAGGGLALLSWLLGALLLAARLSENVRTRRVEIGLRRSLGATPGAIAGLFVAEGLAVALTAALAGAATARAIALRLSRFADLPLLVDGRMWAAPLAVALLTGLLASGLPARAAARLPPAEALRMD